ncbi:MAG: hypothetical protein GDA56_21795 [Hormoscilla sp. GM7CHS1pb]|nr:hypothetical protein [Hormoscilla sp. GM7CHS1pb]
MTYALPAKAQAATRTSGLIHDKDGIIEESPEVKVSRPVLKTPRYGEVLA